MEGQAARGAALLRHCRCLDFRSITRSGMDVRFTQLTRTARRDSLSTRVRYSSHSDGVLAEAESSEPIPRFCFMVLAGSAVWKICCSGKCLCLPSSEKKPFNFWLVLLMFEALAFPIPDSKPTIDQGREGEEVLGRNISATDNHGGLQLPNFDSYS